MRLWLASALLLVAAACNRGGRDAQAPPPPAPACPCACPAGPTPVAGGAPAPLAAGPEDAQGLISSASRKANHGDGLGCLQDLDRLLAADARHAEQQTILRAQCEMLSGRCLEGKQRIDAWSAYQLNTPAEQRLRFVEAMAGMYCRGGNMTDRDRLLAAHHQLTQGAYITQLSVAECRAAYQTVRSLTSKVPPRSADDDLVSTRAKSVYHTAANCFARAGDCSAARRAFDESFPQESLANVKDAKLRQQVSDEVFKSVARRCVP